MNYKLRKVCMYFKHTSEKLFFGLLALFIGLLSIPLQAQEIHWTDTLIPFDLKEDMVSIQNRGIWNAGRTESYLSNNGYVVTVPYNYNDAGQDADCLNFDLNFPAMSEYQDMADPWENDNLRGIQYFGRYEVNRTLIDKYGLSKDLADYGRKIATWQWAKDNGVPGNDSQTGFGGLHSNGSLSEDESNRLIAFINELRWQTKANIPTSFSINFDGIVSQTVPQQTNPMGIDAYMDFKVNVSSPAYVTDLNGNNKTSFSAGEEFIVAAPANFIGELEVTVTTEEVFYNMLYLKATVNGNQDLMTGQMSDPLEISSAVALDFKGALFDLDIEKLIDKMYPNIIAKYDMTEFSFKVVSENLSYSKVVRMDKDGKNILKDLIYSNDYTIQEVSVPVGVQIDNKKYPLDVKAGETYKYELHNDEIPSWIAFHKVDTNTGNVPNVTYNIYQYVLKNADGSYKLDENGNIQVDSASLLLKDYKTDVQGNVLSDALPSGLREVWVVEAKVPDHIIIDSIPRLVKLEENKITTVEYLNNIISPFQIWGIKTDEFGNPLADMLFDIVDLSTGKVVATVRTDSMGYFISPILQKTDINNKLIEYELREQAHPLFKPLAPIKFNGEGMDSKKQVEIPSNKLVNYYKEIQYVLPKVAEKNIYNINADGSKFDIVDRDTLEVYATGITKKELTTFTTINAYNILNKNIGYVEVEVAEHFEKDETIYEIETVTEAFLKDYVSGTPIYLRDKDKPFENKLKPITIGTTATTSDGGKIIKPNTIEDVVDKIDLCNAIKGEQYTFVGVAMDKRTGKPLQTVNGEVWQTKTFIATGGCETIEMWFVIDTTGFTEDVDIVFYEWLFYNPNDKEIDIEVDEPVAEHTDINDEGQTIQLLINLVETGQRNNIVFGAVCFIISLSLYLWNVLRKRKKEDTDVEIY